MVKVEEVLSRLSRRIEVVLEYQGVKVLDLRMAELLKLVNALGSLLAAARALGVPYSRAWEWVSRAELALGFRILERRRGGPGGGGAKLTREGLALLQYYEDLLRELGLSPAEPSRRARGLPQLLVAGSHDPALELLVGLLRRRHGVDVEASWIGSSGGLASLMLGEADVAGVHLYHPETGTYNIPYLKYYWLEGRVALVRGYRRELVLLHHPGVEVGSVDEVLEELAKGELRLINRNVGSGTRVLLDYMLRRFCEERGLSFTEVVKGIRGYEVEVRTHVEVASAVAEGSADVGLALRYVAELYGLRYVHVTWENYDLVVLRERLEKPGVRKLLELFRSPTFTGILRSTPGYEVPEDFGRIIEA